MLKNVKCARCVRCGKEYEAVPNLTNCSCGGILDIVYDYDYIKAHLTKETLKNRVNPTMWRYRELLPVEETTPDTPLRVGWSPLYEEPKLAEQLGLGRLWVKDDGINPTASLKDRASAMAVAKAHEAGAKIIACSSTGNAASSLAGNAAAAGFKTYIFVPERAPKGKVAQLMIFGANVISVKGNYEETFKMSAEAIEKWGWYNRNAAINPYLSEGKKTVSLEIAEQLNWEMPDYLAISVGDGCTIAGVWKGLKDLYAIGFIDKLPRLISAQSTGCYPINRAIQENKPWEPMEENTIADSISVGVPRNADKALMAIRESNGLAINVTDEEILAAQKLLGRTCGVFGEPAGVTGTAAVKKACELGLIEKGATVVSVVTGNGLKDVANAIKSAGEPINIRTAFLFFLPQQRVIGLDRLDQLPDIFRQRHRAVVHDRVHAPDGRRFTVALDQPIGSLQPGIGRGAPHVAARDIRKDLHQRTTLIDEDHTLFAVDLLQIVFKAVIRGRIERHVKVRMHHLRIRLEHRDRDVWGLRQRVIRGKQQAVLFRMQRKDLQPAGTGALIIIIRRSAARTDDAEIRVALGDVGNDFGIRRLSQADAIGDLPFRKAVAEGRDAVGELR